VRFFWRWSQSLEWVHCSVENQFLLLYFSFIWSFTMHFASCASSMVGCLLLQSKASEAHESLCRDVFLMWTCVVSVAVRNGDRCWNQDGNVNGCRVLMLTVSQWRSQIIEVTRSRGLRHATSLAAAFRTRWITAMVDLGKLARTALL